MDTRVLITTSGVGLRLGDLIKYTNKALIKIGDKPVICHIIDSYPKSTTFVITLGYFGNQVRELLELVYKDRKFIFVEVDKYQGPGSSLLYSMICAKEELQCKFIYHACDTIVESFSLDFDQNFLGGFVGPGSSDYASIEVVGQKVNRISDKGAIRPDYLYVGVCGVVDYQKFWKKASDIIGKKDANNSFSDVDVTNELLTEGVDFEVLEFKNWSDTGNVSSLSRTRDLYASSYSILTKQGEEIFFFKDRVVKFFFDTKIAKNRVLRSSFLKESTPQILGYGNNFYSYKYTKGDLMAKVADVTNFGDLLRWSSKKLWKKVEEVSKDQFEQVCLNFYKTKTEERVKKFIEERGVKDKEETINGVLVPKVEDILRMVDFGYLSKSEQTGFHGDFILDNILKTDKGFVLIDWRQDFGGLLQGGDKYYDLSKLHHNLIVNHEIVDNGNYTINISKEGVYCDILRKQSLVECESELFKWIDENHLDRKKVDVLTAIIWLNMSPLHEHPFDKFLFYFGKYNLYKALKNNYEQRN